MYNIIDSLILPGGLCPGLCFNWFLALSKGPLDQHFVNGKLRPPIYAMAHYLAEQLLCPEQVSKEMGKQEFSRFLKDASEFLSTVKFQVQFALFDDDEAPTTLSDSSADDVADSATDIPESSEEKIPKRPTDRLTVIKRVRDRRGSKPEAKSIDKIADLNFGFADEHVGVMGISEALLAAGLSQRNVSLVENGLSRLEKKNQRLRTVADAIQFIQSDPDKEYAEFFFVPHQISAKMSNQLCVFFLKLNTYRRGKKEKEVKDESDSEKEGD